MGRPVVILHHTLTVVAFLLIPLFWVMMNVFMLNTSLPRVTLAELARTWNEHRLTGEPWGILDREYYP